MLLLITLLKSIHYVSLPFLCPVLLAFYFLASSYIILSAFLFLLLRWGSCCLFPKTLFLSQYLGSSFYLLLISIARLCPPCFLVWLFQASSLLEADEPREQLWVLRDSQLSSNHQQFFYRPGAVNRAQLVEYCLTEELHSELHFQL